MFIVLLLARYRACSPIMKYLLVHCIIALLALAFSVLKGVFIVWSIFVCWLWFIVSLCYCWRGTVILLHHRLVLQLRLQYKCTEVGSYSLHFHDFSNCIIINALLLYCCCWPFTSISTLNEGHAVQWWNSRTFTVLLLFVSAVEHAVQLWNPRSFIVLLLVR